MNQLITFEEMNVEHMTINERIVIDAMDLVTHLTNYYVTLKISASEYPELEYSAETIRNLALFLLEAHDIAQVQSEEIFGKELDILLEQE